MLFEDLFAISLIPGVGDKTLKKASEFITANALLNASDDELADVFPTKKAADIFCTSFDDFRALAKQKRQQLMQMGAVILHRDNSKYPQRLLTNPDHPVFLYCLGDPEMLNNRASAAISGPRKPSQAGIENAKRTAISLNSHGITVISGLATGIDTAAHSACLESGNTIAVLPFLTPVYPPQNEALCNKIIEKNGCVIAPSIEQFNIKFQLLHRDKVIIGMSDSLYVPDAFASDSGTAYTVNYALNHSKAVYLYKNGRYTKATNS
ncbi:MAG: hypothetical protein E7312_06480 [Clostridiales bacterium]|nr:hypothetical protein [Clostridiales bacterium]